MALQRAIGLFTAAAIVVGEVIAVGIFLTPAEMAKSLGAPLWVLLVWLVMGAMALCGALCYGELAARYPEAGGGYAYLREAYGPLPAFLYGWMALLVMDPGITAALAVGLASYAAYIGRFSPFEVKAVAIAAIWVVAVVNVMGARAGAGLLRALALAKLGVLLFIAVWSVVGGFGEWGHFTPFFERRAGSPPLVEALAGGMVAAFFSFGGWWDLSKLAGEVRDPTRVMPRALALGVSAATLVYITTSAVFWYLVPVERVTSGETFAAQAGEAMFGRFGGGVFAAIVIIAVAGSLAAVMMTAPRVYYAMARDGLFFSGVARLHERFGTPARAIIIQAALASALVALGTFNQIIAYFIFVVVLFLALTVAVVFVLRRRPGSPPAYQTSGYPLTPAIFLALVAVLLGLLALGNPRQSALGVAVVALGAPVYWLLFRKRVLRARF